MAQTTKVKVTGQVPKCGPVAVEMVRGGLSVIRIKEDGSKAPIGKWKHLQTERADEDTVRHWFSNGEIGVGVVCGEVSGGLEMLEFEGRTVDAGLHHEFFARAKAVGLAKLVGRIANGYQEMTPSGGIHLFYRCPRPNGNTALAHTADEKPLVLIETRGEGGYAIVAPSNGRVHPDGGCWELVKGGWASVATITEGEHAALLDLARSFDQKPVSEAEPPPTASQGVGGRPGDAFNSQAAWADFLPEYGWTYLYTDRTGEAFWRRPGQDYGHQATTNYQGNDLLHVFSTNAAPFEAGRSYTKFTALTILDTGKAHPDQDDFARVARELAEEGFVLEDAAGVSDAQLPDEFWDARDVLRHVRQAARARLVGPDAALAGVLAQLAVHIPPRMRLDTGIAMPASLNTLHALVADSSGGKGTGVSVGFELLPDSIFHPRSSVKGSTVHIKASTHRVRHITLGSGEGLIDQFFVRVPDPENKRRNTWERRCDGVLVRVDEGQILVKLGQRSGQTTMEMLRQADSGETLGNSYANGRPNVEAHSYRLVLLCSIQPEHVRSVLKDDQGGTPQRFVWWQPYDDEASVDQQPKWPGPLQISAPLVREPFTLSQTIKDEIQAEHVKRLARRSKPAPYDGKRNLNRLKVAAVLAVLDGRTNVDDEDWRLAGIVMDTSDAIRDDLLARFAKDDEAKREAGHKHSADRAVRTESAVSTHQAQVRAHAQRLVRVVERKGPCSGRDLNASINSKYRHLTDDAVALALKEDWIKVDDDDNYDLGKQRP